MNEKLYVAYDMLSNLKPTFVFVAENYFDTLKQYLEETYTDSRFEFSLIKKEPALFIITVKEFGVTELGKEFEVETYQLLIREHNLNSVIEFYD